MELEKNNYINSLFEFYSPLLTTKQVNYLERYYVDDYSLGEIAAEFDISRQAVYDNIRRSEKILQQYEVKLGLYQGFKQRNQKLDQIKQYAQEHYPDDSQLSELIDSLEITEEE